VNNSVLSIVILCSVAFSASKLVSSVFTSTKKPVPPSISYPESTPFGLTFPAKVVYIVDGDTIDVRVTHIVRIRLKDCWAPETHTKDKEEKKRGLASKAYLTKLLLRSKDVKVYVPTKVGGKFGDSFSFGRALGYVWVDGASKSTSELMVRAGYATATKVKKKHKKHTP